MNKKILSAVLATTMIFSGTVTAIASESVEFNINQNMDALQADIAAMVRLAKPMAQQAGQESIIAEIEEQMIATDLTKEVPSIKEKLNNIIYKDNGKEKILDKSKLQNAYDDAVFAYEHNNLDTGTKALLVKHIRDAKVLLSSPNSTSSQVEQVTANLRSASGMKAKEDIKEVSELREIIKKVEELGNKENNSAIVRAKTLILNEASQEEIKEEINKLQSIIDTYNTSQLENYKSKAVDFINSKNILNEHKKEYIDRINNAEDSIAVDAVKKEAEAKALELSAEEYKGKINELLNISKDEKLAFNKRIDNKEDAEKVYKEALDSDSSNLRNGKDALLSAFGTFRHINPEKIKETKNAFDLAKTVEEAKSVLDSKQEVFEKENNAIAQIKNMTNIDNETMDAYITSINNGEDIDSVLDAAVEKNAKQSQVKRYSIDEVSQLKENLKEKLSDNRVQGEMRENAQKALDISEEMLTLKDLTVRELDDLGKTLFEQYGIVQNYLLGLDEVNKNMPNKDDEENKPQGDDGEQTTTNGDIVDPYYTDYEARRSVYSAVKKDNLKLAIEKAENFLREGVGSSEQDRLIVEALSKARTISYEDKYTQTEVDAMEKELLDIMGNVKDKPNKDIKDKNSKKEEAKKTDAKEQKESKKEVKTGVDSVAGIAGLLSVAAMAFVELRKKK